MFDALWFAYCMHGEIRQSTIMDPHVRSNSAIFSGKWKYFLVLLSENGRSNGMWRMQGMWHATWITCTIYIDWLPTPTIVSSFEQLHFFFHFISLLPNRRSARGYEKLNKNKQQQQHWCSHKLYQPFLYYSRKISLCVWCTNWVCFYFVRSTLASHNPHRSASRDENTGNTNEN